MISLLQWILGVFDKRLLSFLTALGRQLLYPLPLPLLTAWKKTDDCVRLDRKVFHQSVFYIEVNLCRCEIPMLVIFLIGQKYLNSRLLNHYRGLHILDSIVFFAALNTWSWTVARYGVFLDLPQPRTWFSFRKLSFYPAKCYHTLRKTKHSCHATCTSIKSIQIINVFKQLFKKKHRKTILKEQNIYLWHKVKCK